VTEQDLDRAVHTSVHEQPCAAPGHGSQRNLGRNRQLSPQEIAVLIAYAFERVGVVLGDIYFVDPAPDPGQGGPEHGVRLEVRLMERPEHDGSIYAARPVLVDRPVWRADLLESVDGVPGSFDRTHHHPEMVGWEPGRRRFEPELTADPMAWVAARLRDLPALLAQAGLAADAVQADDAAELARATPEIVAAAAQLLDRVRAGELGRAPDDAGTTSGVTDAAGGTALVRSGWL
jgi:hypothetical protein